MYYIRYIIYELFGIFTSFGIGSILTRYLSLNLTIRKSRNTCLYNKDIYLNKLFIKLILIVTTCKYL